MEKQLYNDAVSLLKQLISTPSFSKEENDTADAIESFLQIKKYYHVQTELLNNIWCQE